MLWMKLRCLPHYCCVHLLLENNYATVIIMYVFDATVAKYLVRCDYKLETSYILEEYLVHLLQIQTKPPSLHFIGCCYA
jgi:hypothetical protein